MEIRLIFMRLQLQTFGFRYHFCVDCTTVPSSTVPTICFDWIQADRTIWSISIPQKKCRNHFQLRIHMNCHRFQQLHNQQQDKPWNKQVQSAKQFPTNANSLAYCLESQTKYMLVLAQTFFEIEPRMLIISFQYFSIYFVDYAYIRGKIQMGRMCRLASSFIGGFTLEFTRTISFALHLFHFYVMPINL